MIRIIRIIGKIEKVGKVVIIEMFIEYSCGYPKILIYPAHCGKLPNIPNLLIFYINFKLIAMKPVYNFLIIKASPILLKLEKTKSLGNTNPI